MSLNVIVVYYSKGIAAAIIAISFLYLQDGKLVDVITALLAGGLGYLVVEILLDRRLHAQFIPNFLGSLVIGIISVAIKVYVRISSAIPTLNLAITLAVAGATTIASAQSPSAIC